jgi:hypothetical protein
MPHPEASSKLCFDLFKCLFLSADELHQHLKRADLGDVADALTLPASLDAAASAAADLLNKRGATRTFLHALSSMGGFSGRTADLAAVLATLPPEPLQDDPTRPARILLLADLQVGMPSKLHIEATASLPGAIARACEGQHLDGVLMLGDLVWSGQEREYEDLRRFVVDPLRAHSPCQSASWFAVPGNHDVDGDASFVPLWDHLGPRRNVFFADSDEGRRARKPRVPSFLAFERFVVGAAIQAPLPSERVASPIMMPFADQGIGLTLLNTSWFSDPSVDSLAYIPAPIQSLQDVLAVHGRPKGLVVVGHHPIDAFRIEDRTHLRRFLREHHGLYLHGHVSAPWTPQDNHVLRELGFGATTRGAGADRFISNTFAVVTLGQEVGIAFHRWNSPAEGWQSVANAVEKKGTARGCSPPWHDPGGRSLRGPEFEVGPLTPRIEGISCLDVPSVADWKGLLRRLRLVETACEPREQPVSSHEVHFFDESTSRRRLIVCLAGSGRVLSESEILEASNTLDLADYDAYTILTFGELATEALAAYERLAEKKALRVVDRRKIIDCLVEELSPRARALIQSVDPTQVHVRIVFFKASEYILLSDSVARRWIELHDADGNPLPDTADAVIALREFKSSYGDAYYGRERDVGAPYGPSVPVPKQTFDSEKYKEALFEEFNSVRYAPLAALGLGFSRTTLTDLYVDTSAQMEETSSSEAQLARALDEIMDSVEIDAGLREQLRHNLRSALGVELLGESDIARRLYQKHGSLLVLGNPGSGKTFFAKHQLLAYCRPPPADAGWYARHLPVYVPLAEAAKHLGDTGLLDIAAQLPMRPSLAVPARELHELYAEGRLALFLDGLDEVTSLAQRGQIAEQLSKFLDEGRASGNRFVLTSRPSAVQVVRIAPDLPSMTLCGLDERQIRMLTQRVLRAHISEGISGPRLSLDGAEAHHARLADQLLEDIHNTPGVRRLATNPLLLTLLIMVYMNSGAPSAKRHRIYQQGAQTLITIRGRNTGQPVLSESDLRRRLGSVALEVFRGRSTIPSMAHVLKIMERTLSSEQHRRVSPGEVERYLQQVADATGIIVLHSDSRDAEGGHVTFMHYSFAEYYAALGLEAAKTPFDEVAKLSQSHRWREVITLYAGLLGEFGDHLKAFIDALLRNRGSMDYLTLESLFFAFDCALESDVPPEAVQESLLRESKRAMGAILRFDRDLRIKLAKRLERLYAGSRSRLVIAFLCDGLKRTNADERAAYVEVFAQVFADEQLDDGLLTALTAACDSQDVQVFRALCRTTQHGSFGQNLVRSPALKKLLEGALSKTLAYQIAALQCIERVPPLSREFQAKIESRMRSPQAILATSASRAFVEANTSAALDDELYRHKLLEALRSLAARGTSVGKYSVDSDIDRRVVERFLSSHLEADRELGVYLLPWLHGEGAFVREQVMEILRAKEGGGLAVAALSSLRISEASIGPLRLTEMAEVRRCVDDPHRDVRMAAVRALAEIGKHEAGTLQTLLSYARQHHKGQEFCEAVRAVVRCGHDDDDVLAFLAEEIGRRLSVSRNDATQHDLVYLLECAALCDWTDDTRTDLCKQMKKLVDDPQMPVELRVHSISTFVVMCKIDASVVDYLVRQLEKRTTRAVRLQVPDRSGDVPDALSLQTKFYQPHLSSTGGSSECARGIRRHSHTREVDGIGDPIAGRHTRRARRDRGHPPRTW